MSETMVCTVCRQQKAALRVRNSKLIPGLRLMLCESCFNGKKEPRFAIILLARQGQVDKVLDYVKNNRYVGDPILLEDIIL